MIRSRPRRPLNLQWIVSLFVLICVCLNINIKIYLVLYDWINLYCTYSLQDSTFPYTISIHKLKKMCTLICHWSTSSNQTWGQQTFSWPPPETIINMNRVLLDIFDYGDTEHHCIISKGGSSKYMTCKMFITDTYFSSNLTNKSYNTPKATISWIVNQQMLSTF